MINREYLAMLGNKSVIRELSEYATARGKEIGYDNVFDFSLGNPSVPAPESYRDNAIRLLQEEEPLKLHGYNPTQGDPRVHGKSYFPYIRSRRSHCARDPLRDRARRGSHRIRAILF